MPASIGTNHGPRCPLSMNGEIVAMATNTTSGPPSGGGTGRQSASSELMIASRRTVSEATMEPVLAKKRFVNRRTRNGGAVPPIRVHLFAAFTCFGIQLGRLLCPPWIAPGLPQLCLHVV